jgi:hypothetical protein
LPTNYCIRDASHRNNRRPDQSFAASNIDALGFLPKVLVPAQEGFAVPRCFFHVKREPMTMLDQEHSEPRKPCSG